jgi:uncharacterized protein with HEPN domain
MSTDDVAYLRHMLDAASMAVQFLQTRTRADLDADQMLALAVARLLEIVGEAARNVSAETKQAQPLIPWQQMTATRNLVSSMAILTLT